MGIIRSYYFAGLELVCLRAITIKYWLFAVSLIALTSLKCLADETSQSMRVKALFLFNFANYVEWPEAAFESPSSSIRMCLYGDLPFGKFLNSVNNTLIGQRRLNIVLTKSRSDIVDGCQILFVSENRKEEIPEFFNHLKYIYILSVGDQDGFSEKGGIINIVRTADKFKFDVNLANAEARGLFISSELLALAREIKLKSGESLTSNSRSEEPLK